MYTCIYKFHVHLIPSHIMRLMAKWWEQWTWKLEAVRCWWFKSYRGQDFFVMLTCSVFLAAGLAAFKWNQACHSSEVIGAERERERERERENFKSREVKRLKECALALRWPCKHRISVHKSYHILYSDSFCYINIYIIILPSRDQ